MNIWDRKHRYEAVKPCQVVQVLVCLITLEQLTIFIDQTPPSFSPCPQIAC